ncbi:MAG TPA: hypothetical protein PLJ34_10095, partial [Hyphomicrobiales bacterium]|nr:hypothetical protein [Hyphomicrobiales bacterium]
DKHVPIALIAMLLIQSATMIWWAAKLDAAVVGNTDKIAATERRLDKLEGQNEKIIRLEEKLGHIAETLEKIEAALRRAGGD